MSAHRCGSTRRALFGATTVLLILGSAVLAGCGGSAGDETAFVPVAGADSAYCDTYRAYKAQEIDGGGAYDQPNPAALRKWWNDYLIFEETMLREAPPEIGDEVAIKVSFIRTVLTPLLEKYDFDLKRMQRESAAEAAVVREPASPTYREPRRPNMPTRRERAGQNHRHLPQTSSSRRTDRRSPSARP